MKVRGSFEMPIEPDAMSAISQILRAQALLSPSFDPLGVDIYDPVVYRHEEFCYGTATVLHLDRNVLTRVVAIARGCQPSREHRRAAAVMAFAQCANIGIEPNIALYEYASKEGQTAASEELGVFRRADNVHPHCWAAVALGHATSVGVLPGTPDWTINTNVDFAMRLRRWNRNYVLCLKLAEVELSGGKASDRYRAFLRWSFDEFLLGGPAIALAAQYLAPNGTRRRLLKQLKSADRRRALAGVKNAAWDLTLVSEWLLACQASREAGTLVLLCSFDQAIHKIVQAAVGYSLPNDSRTSQARLMEELWGQTLGRQLEDEIERLYSTRDTPGRRINAESQTKSIDAFIAEGEAAILSWAPSG